MPTKDFSNLEGIKGLLLDLNGVFYVGNRIVPGATEAIAFLRERQIPFRFITNNTTESVDALCYSLNSMGLQIKPHETISAPYAAVLHLRRLRNPKCYLLLSPEVKQDFAEFTTSESCADAVVLGDMGNAWNYHELNRAFRLMMQGASLIALHQAKYWQWEGGLHIDIGAFVKGLEYSTDKQALIVGKPSSSFYSLALDELGLPAEQVAVIGDDIQDDVAGGQAMGMQGFLVKTGKYREELVAQSQVKPDGILDSIGAIAELFT
ncbi:MAG: TIGR01458 family HAD-type hydrolase [Leptolyngbyaceae cyanobacterium SM1_1_3]|nr:TIGR01458 family HAD-type hydrolase [Leptolyngbyaceae cyanobacterium SM1_1_3]NJN03898.1 TIGR01458 family HAD-type hydrolase [Leptolyngbyaceae cyanobacterium RM1_1_2]NJO09007.1 TIGR01458 family HAD-type hydrolase [Leptolyngbyaceae cyanobacterium SL_1_1]